MKTTINKSHLNDQLKLKAICDDVCDNIEQLLDSFDLEYKSNAKMITMSCPIHGGDNSSALNLYHEGDRYRGNWNCRTHNCEKTFKGSILGFIRGVLSNYNYGWQQPGDRMCSFEEAVKYALSLLHKDINNIKVSRKGKEKNTFTNVINYINKTTDQPVSRILRSQIIRSLQIPAKYYIDRNYSSDILMKYAIVEFIGGNI